MSEQENLSHLNIKVVLCASSAYTKKYFFNPTFNKLPENVKEELHIISVLFTTEIGGVFSIVFTPEGGVEMETQAEEGDLLYDEIGAGLMVSEIRRKKRELFESLSDYYRVFILRQMPGDVLTETGDEDDN